MSLPTKKDKALAELAELVIKTYCGKWKPNPYPISKDYHVEHKKGLFYLVADNTIYFPHYDIEEFIGNVIYAATNIPLDVWYVINDDDRVRKAYNKKYVTGTNKITGVLGITQDNTGKIFLDCLEEGIENSYEEITIPYSFNEEGLLERVSYKELFKMWEDEEEYYEPEEKYLPY